jgi:hypothetical protein
MIMKSIFVIALMLPLLSTLVVQDASAADRERRNTTLADATWQEGDAVYSVLVIAVERRDGSDQQSVTFMRSGGAEPELVGFLFDDFNFEMKGLKSASSNVDELRVCRVGGSDADCEVVSLSVEWKATDDPVERFRERFVDELPGLDGKVTSVNSGRTAHAIASLSLNGEADKDIVPDLELPESDPDFSLLQRLTFSCIATGERSCDEP